MQVLVVSFGEVAFSTGAARADALSVQDRPPNLSWGPASLTITFLCLEISQVNPCYHYWRRPPADASRTVARARSHGSDARL